MKNICQSRSRKKTDYGTIISSSKEKDRVIYVHKGASRDLLVNDFLSKNEIEFGRCVFQTAPLKTENNV